MDKKEIILNTLDALCFDFLYYDRKEDEELSADDLRNAIKNGDITIDEMVECFRENIESIERG